MSFIPVSHWESKTWNNENETKATEKYFPIIMSMLVKSVKMCKSDEQNFMVITEQSNGQVAKKATDKIASVKEEAFEFNIIIISSYAGETFASN